MDYLNRMNLLYTSILYIGTLVILFQDHWWMCYLYGLAANSVTLISAWLVVLITVLRLLAVARPFSLYRPKNASENIDQALNYIYILILICFLICS